ncbi:hypothetical protein KW800_00980 [Candidatus Parcubacteria bacterium]|nr:hypothetical protein [Candidatus Parcubacteria bacterium]
MTFRRALLPHLFFLTLILPVGASAQTLPAPTKVDILWQGETYTPPFYLGRALWGHQTRITLVAVVSGNTNPNALIYKWTQGGTVLGNSSGAGRRTLSWNDSVLSLPTEVRVDVTLPDGQTDVGSASVSLIPTTSETLVVEDSPLYGLMLHRAIGESFDLGGQEVSFSALPFFSGVSSRTAPAETYRWLASGSDDRSGNKVTYRIPDNSSGSSRVTVEARNKSALVQPLDKSFLVQFGKQNSF